MTMVRITAGPFVFGARFEEAAGAGDLRRLRGAAAVPQQDHSGALERRVGLDSAGRVRGGRRFRERTPATPRRGEILLYPGGYSETEILFPYGPTLFASKLGQLAGNHFLTIVEGREQLRDLGRLVLWEGAQDIALREGCRMATLLLRSAALLVSMDDAGQQWTDGGLFAVDNVIHSVGGPAEPAADGRRGD